MTLVVVGPVQAKAVRAVVDQTFGQRPAPANTPPANPPLKPIKEIVRVKVDRPEQQALPRPAPRRGASLADAEQRRARPGRRRSWRQRELTAGADPRAIPGGCVSRVATEQRLAEALGIVHIQVRLEAADVDKVEKRILEEITRLQKDGPTEDERRAGGHTGGVRPRHQPTRPRTAWPGLRHHDDPGLAGQRARAISTASETITRAQIQASGAEVSVDDRLRVDRVRAQEGAMIRRTLGLVAVLSLCAPCHRLWLTWPASRGASCPTASP